MIGARQVNPQRAGLGGNRKPRCDQGRNSVVDHEAIAN